MLTNTDVYYATYLRVETYPAYPGELDTCYSPLSQAATLRQAIADLKTDSAVSEGCDIIPYRFDRGHSFEVPERIYCYKERCGWFGLFRRRVFLPLEEIPLHWAPDIESGGGGGHRRLSQIPNTA